MNELVQLFWSPALPANVNLAIVIWIALGVYGFRLIQQKEQPRVQAKDQAWFAEQYRKYEEARHLEALLSDPPPAPPQIGGRKT